MKKYIEKSIFNFILAVLLVTGSAIIGLLLLMGVYSLPADNIVKNVSESVDIIEEEGTYPLWGENFLIRLSPENMRDPKALLFNNRMTARDNYTDSYMLLNASYFGDEPLLERTLKVYRYNNFQDQPHLTLSYAYKEGHWEDLDVVEYARYWHGYLVFLKPLLELLNYGQIRIFNLILMSLLLILDIGIIARKYRNRFTKGSLFAICFGFLFFMPFTVPFCMQFCTCSYVLLFAFLILALKGENLCKKERVWLLFLGIGIVTSYVDYLTFPLTTFGLPLLLLWTLFPEQTRSFERLISYGISWCFGYIGMWAFKWIFVNLLLGEDLIGEAINQVLFRASSETDNGEGTISIFGAIGSNFCNYINILYLLLILVAIIWILRQIMKNGIEIQNGRYLYLLVALIPIGWYVVFRNHSYGHGSFTYRNLSVLVQSGLLFFAKERKQVDA